MLLGAVPLLLIGLPFARAAGVAPGGPATLERYTYQSTRAGWDDAACGETVEVEIRHVGTTLVCRALTVAPNREQTVTVTTTTDGGMISASREESAAGRAAARADVWLENGRVRIRNSAGRVVEYPRPADRPLAVDASLLLLLRTFPFDSGRTWNVFMVDFSQNSVHVEVRQLGDEDVAVPAGLFACRRMEVTVQLLIFRPKITYWLAAAPPHFLVKSVGPKGPFTPSYVTVLHSRAAGL